MVKSRVGSPKLFFLPLKKGSFNMGLKRRNSSVAMYSQIRNVPETTKLEWRSTTFSLNAKIGAKNRTEMTKTLFVPPNHFSSGFPEVSRNKKRKSNKTRSMNPLQLMET